MKYSEKILHHDALNTQGFIQLDLENVFKNL